MNEVERRAMRYIFTIEDYLARASVKGWQKSIDGFE
jgi:hypothetical protein